MSYIVLSILLLIAFCVCRTFKWHKSPFAGSPQIFINIAVCKCSNCSSVSSVSASQIDPLFVEAISVFCRSRRASCHLLAKEWALNTGKLPPGGLPMNSVVK